MPKFLGGERWRVLQLLLSIWAFDFLLVMLMAPPMLNPPPEAVQELFMLMGISGSFSLLVAWLVFRLGLIRWFRSLRYGLLLLTVLIIGVVFFNVWFLAQAMFFESHDLNLTAIVLIFAAWTALGCGYFISVAFTRRIMTVAQGADRLAAGDLGARVPVDGNDEVASLSQTFNMMAQRLQDAAEQKERLEQSRRDLIAWASHDLRTPLASLQLVTDALVDGVVDDTATQQRYLQTAQKEVANLKELINDLFELSQLESGHIDLKLQQTSLSDLLSDTLSAMRAMAERRGVRLDGHVSRDIDPVLIDPEKIQRVLYNLLSNAIRHTPAGGEVLLMAEVTGSGVRVTVRDSGEGIAVEDLPHIFDRFYRGERARTRDKEGLRGAGLGLAIARGLIEAHRGTIEVDSLPGQGARFSFTLPRTAPV
ncbi:MAG: two-component sensor histidine kinase [Anaerolineaceae bacterium]|nr:two-component sensor histidine kinase [Anaerolineaceae bacterium]